ncbi:hypothetical protein [Microbacterium sp. gxy059]|uniref:hypothetical protein n=1 Tax=Microbacterium sp. gxy059 TaxID=2957199 RepID=UPI003D9949E0
MSSDDFPQRFADALVSEIKAEMGRQSYSSRALGRLIGKTSQYMSDRLDGGSPKTRKRVILNARDISAIARALDLSEVELVARAEQAALRPARPRLRAVSPNVSALSNREALETVELDPLALAASDDDSAPTPDQGEA